MNTNYREMLGIKTLGEACGVDKDARNLKQKKAIKNIKYCADDQWCFVNSWYDCQDESARAYMMNAKELFDTIYSESQDNIYDDGAMHFGSAAQSYLKDIRFCGKDFLQRVCFYYVAKLLEDSVGEVDGTEEDAAKVLEDLKSLKSEIYGIEVTEESTDDLKKMCSNVQNGDALIENIATVATTPVKTTKKSEKWISIPHNLAVILRTYLSATESNLKREDISAKKVRYYNDHVQIILNNGANPYIWCVA